MTYFFPIMASAPLTAGSGAAAGSGVTSGTGSAAGSSGASPVRSYQSVRSLISRLIVPSSRSVMPASPSGVEMSSIKPPMLQDRPSSVMPCRVRSQVSP